MGHLNVLSATVALALCASSTIARAQVLQPVEPGPSAAPESEPSARGPLQIDPPAPAPRDRTPVVLACEPGEPGCTSSIIVEPPVKPPRVDEPHQPRVPFTGATFYDGCLTSKQGLTAVGYCYDGDFVGPLFVGGLINVDFDFKKERRLRVFGLGQVGLVNGVAQYEGFIRAGVTNISAVSRSADFSVVNVALEEHHGVQIGAVSYAQELVGMQISGIAGASKTKGIQIAGIGVSAHSLTGLQIVGLGGSDRFKGLQLAGGVAGMRFTGLRVAGVGMTFDRFVGLGLGGVHVVVDGPATGVLAGAGNYVEERMVGGMLGALNLVNDRAVGLQAGGVNYADGGIIGAQLGVVNASGEDAGGLQLGVFNYADNNRGLQAGAINVDAGTNESLQIGLFNYAERLDGVQLGLFNISAEGGLPFMLFMNMK